jgi:hypothetical protein
MKKLSYFILGINILLTSCNQKSGSISGSWTTPIEGQPQHRHGFTLKDEGTASVINLADKHYNKWEKFGDRLILYAKSQDSKKPTTDTLKILSVNDSTMVVKVAGGREVIYTKTTTPDKLISDFEHYDCYQYATKKDTAFLHINIANNIVTGDLTYQLFEKDRNQGTIRGQMSGDTLMADYTFSSEGHESVREIVLIKKGNDLIEGFGELIDQDGKLTFLDHRKINFKKGLTFRKINCP